MNQWLTTPTWITLKAIPLTAAPAPISITLKPAPEKPAAGEPGKTAGDVVFIPKDTGSAALTISLGQPFKPTPETFRKAGGGLARWIKQTNPVSLDMDLAGLSAFNVPGALAAFCEGILLGAFEFTHFKSKKEERTPVLISLRTGALADVEATITHADRLTRAVNLAREWAHEPPNVIDPITLAERIQALAPQLGIKCTVLDDTALAEMNAGGILNVGRGSHAPSRLIILEYPGKTQVRPVALVGKALTFDTGGYSLKGVDNILGMKYDKCGGLAVLGALLAAAALELPTPVVGIIGAAENRISEQSYLPDDIITTLSGKTVEILSTDAEGRMVLADCLTYVQQKFQPSSIVDLATLTGGVVTALGSVRAGMMVNNDALAKQLFDCGERTFERLWQLPLDDEYLQNILGEDGDLKNSGGRQAHPINGGIFLKQFVADEIPWAHLDIAGMGDFAKELPYCPKGGTGFGVRLLIDYLESLT